MIPNIMILGSLGDNQEDRQVVSATRVGLDCWEVLLIFNWLIDCLLTGDSDALYSALGLT
jgi:hypothetical protein